MAAAREFLQRLVPRLQAVEKLALRSALGRVLAEDIVSPIDVPAQDNSAMDGYAFRAADLAVAGETGARGRRQRLRRRRRRAPRSAPASACAS